MQRVYCHNCMEQFIVSAHDWDGNCPRCGEGFVEAMGQESPRADQSRQPGYHSSFQLPGGVGTVHVMYGSGSNFGGMPGHLNGGSYMGPAPDPLELIRALMGGSSFGGQDNMFGGFGAEYDQEQMDLIITQIMNQYQPQSRETARRIRDNLPRLKVRPRPASTSNKPGASEHAAAETAAEPATTDDSEIGMAAVCAGEPCSVCHDEFEGGDEVVELPCNHCFHEDCLMPWLEAHNTCPICRLELPTEHGRQHSRRQQQQQGGGGSTSRASSRQPRSSSSEEDEVGPSQGRGFFGGLNQLLHNIADRWEQSHVQRGEAGNESAAAAGCTSSTGPAASRQPSSRSGAPPPATAPSMSTHTSVPDSPRTAAGRAAAARAAGMAGPAGSSTQQSASFDNSRSADFEHSEAAASHRATGGHGTSQPEPEEVENSAQLGMAVGGVLAALVGGAVSAFMGRNRQQRNQ